MNSALEAFRQEEAKLRDRKRGLSDQADKSVYVGIGLGLAAIGLAAIPGIPVIGSVVLASTYFVPTMTMGLASFQSSEKLEKINEDLTAITAAIGLQNEYEQLIVILTTPSGNEPTKTAVVDIIKTRHVDRLVRELVRDMGDRIETRKLREHYDHVELPGLRGGFGNSSGRSAVT